MKITYKEIASLYNIVVSNFLSDKHLIDRLDMYLGQFSVIKILYECLEKEEQLAKEDDDDDK